jgi:hypothetical protein
METIDKLTLQLLMNKNTYSRYIEKTDPKKFKEEQEFKEKIKKYKSRILSFTIKYLDDTTLQLNNEMDAIMRDYMKTYIKYFEMIDLEVSNFYGDHEREKDADEDTMFVNMDRGNSTSTSNINSPIFEDLESASVVADIGSITAENANKLLCRYTMDKYVMRK